MIHRRVGDLGFLGCKSIVKPVDVPVMDPGFAGRRERHGHPAILSDAVLRTNLHPRQRKGLEAVVGAEGVRPRFVVCIDERQVIPRRGSSMRAADRRRDCQESRW